MMTGMPQQEKWRSPAEVLDLLIEYVPTFFVDVFNVAAILDDEPRAYVQNRMKIAQFFRKYAFHFEVRMVDGGMTTQVRLRDDVHHPRRGSADEKFYLDGVGEHAVYRAKPDFVQDIDNIDHRSGASVQVRAHVAPPAIHVTLEEKVPVMEKLKSLIPAGKFVKIEVVEEKIPEEVLFHPYFDCQGGLFSISSKYPDVFQVVEGSIRRRPRHLAPMSLGELGVDDSPMPEVLEVVAKACALHDMPVWISITTLYEQLPVDVRRKVKKQFKSFATFLRMHGRAFAVSPDLLKVSSWTPPPDDGSDVTDATAVQYRPNLVLSALYDKFPQDKTLSGTEAVNVLPLDMRGSAPQPFGAWLASHPKHFVVDNPGELVLDRLRVRRASGNASLDTAMALYPLIPEDGIAAVTLLKKLPPGVAASVSQLGLAGLVQNLSEWLELLDGDVFRKKEMADLQAALAASSGAEPDAAGEQE